MAGAPPNPHAFPSEAQHPQLGWRDLATMLPAVAMQRAPNARFVRFTVLKGAEEGTLRILAYSRRNGATFEKICSRPPMIGEYLLSFAFHHA
jgi:hypothetical protein